MLAILAQNGREVGLFEHMRLIQNDEEIHWFLPVQNPLATLVSPQAQLIQDSLGTLSLSHRIQVLVSPNIVVDRNGLIATQFSYTASFARIPWIVGMWENHESFPLYTMYPEDGLPWITTIRSGVSLPWRVPTPPVYFRLQNLSVDRSALRRSLSANARCPITLGPLSMEDAYWLPCGHAFSDAIFQAAARDARCPLCRRRFELDQIQS